LSNEICIIVEQAFTMNNLGEFEGMEEATLKDLAFLSRSSRESDTKSGLMDV